jgi:hypothetical protein
MSGSGIVVTRDFPVGVSQLWDELRQIDRHVLWMADAVALTFTTDQREGIGTTFHCRTKVGPFVTTDTMTVTSWTDEREMGVTHRGLITGEGLFSIVDLGAGKSRLEWRENLLFPWWALGGLGARVARPVLRLLWRGNLRRLERQICGN